MLKLYYLQGACPLVPHVALHWTKADFEAVRLERGEQKSPAFLALNPQGTVPLLTDGDWTLSQNIAILDDYFIRVEQDKGVQAALKEQGLVG
ncbi:glutathione S-transferase N-terminal domain-containing protein [Lonepinella koalarum]|uniref:Glutathione S-transferase-like protein n=1 Tax=Lonepinella koalarum TaxID=53417 RepID=A0A4R1L038_9PAST|nr:glutathione S-transferase N-terminal domain-containing protein [Lonepinella koalarum]MDH2925991.1 hypothetical protein [Lonepinella koalarum]TCK71144.1 glutathione S-transferase-like protein [Lonepinella koalarum]TFJ90871.1 hypothetical protein E0709_00995 [Lonepinella koalarum]